MRLDSNATYIPPMRLMHPAYGGALMTVDENDLVYAQQETYGKSNDGSGDHRYQIMLMPLGDILGAFWTDLGPASDFVMYEEGQPYLAPPFFQPVLLQHTVGECREMSQNCRMDDFARKLLHEQVNESDLFAKYAQLIEQDMHLVRNRSTFGPHVRIERNGYSRLGAREQERKIQERIYGHI